MKRIKNIISLAAIVALLAACEEPMKEITETNYPRAFSPVEIVVTPGTFDAAKITWRSIDNARKYIVELSRGDSLEFNNIVETRETEVPSVDFSGLWGETAYSVRIKSVAFEDGQSESGWSAIAFSTTAEQVFRTVKEVEVKGTNMTMYFAPPTGTVDNLTIVPAGGVPTTITLTADDIAAGMKYLDGLTPNTEYTVSIFSGTQKRGEVTATTQWKPTGEETNVVVVNMTDDLAQICADPGNIDKIIYLPDGYIYTAAENPGIVLAGNMTLYGNPDAAVKPEIIHSAGGGGNRLFSWPANCNINEIKFVNLSIKGPGHIGNTLFAARGEADRIEVLDNIILDRCDVSDFGRCFMRIEGTIHNPVGKVTLSNCTFQNIGAYGGMNGNYAFFTLNVGGGGINDIEVTSCTFRTVYHSFLNAPLTSGNVPCKSLTITGCTFHDFITGPGATSGRIFIDGNNNTALVININGVIFGQSGPKSSGYRYGTDSGSTSSITVANTYATSDYVNETAAQAIPQVISAGASSSALFKNPADGDFTIIDTSFPGRNTAGDPRWR